MNEIMENRINECEKEILEAERHIWNNPESGFREWKTHAYLAEKFRALGYELHEAGNIPGFYCEADSGREGPCIGVFGEMDSLIVPNHPECDKTTGCAHSCGHNAQCAALLGVAAALKAPGAFDGLCGKVRLFAVPAEELIELEYRQELYDKGIIRYFGGKQEFMARGYLENVDMALMIHTVGGDKASCPDGSNGCIIKQEAFFGVSSHASAPYNGVNALYAATNALNAANAVRETFKDEDTVRFHPIITKGGTAVNAIPDEVTLESYVRGKTFEAMKTNNDKINRAFAGSAAAMGCRLTINDRHGYAPRLNDSVMQEAFADAAKLYFPAEKVRIHGEYGKGCSDFGDVSCVMPAAHPQICGASGRAHGDNYQITDPYTACVVSAKVQAQMIAILLENNAKIAKKVLENAVVPFASVKEYLDYIDSLYFSGEAVKYGENDIKITYKK